MKGHTRSSGIDSEARNQFAFSKDITVELPTLSDFPTLVLEAQLPTFAVNLAVLVSQGGGLEAFATLGTPEAGLMPGLGREGKS